MIHLSRVGRSLLIRGSLWSLSKYEPKLFVSPHGVIPQVKRWCHTNKQINWDIGEDKEKSLLLSESGIIEEMKENRRTKAGNEYLYGFDTEDKNRFWNAIRNNQIYSAIYFAEMYGIDIQDTHGNTALHLAAMYGNLQMIEALVNFGAKIQIKNHLGCSPVLLAVARGRLDVVDAFVGYGLSLNEKDNDGMLPIHYSIFPEDPAFIKALVSKYNLSVDSVCNKFVTPLYLSVEYSPSVTETFIELGANLELAAPDDSITPLFRAVMSENLEAVRLLIKHGANVETRESHLNSSILFASVFYPNSEILEEVCKLKKLDINEYIRGHTPATWAVKENSMECLKVLHKYGASLAKTLEVAVEHERKDMIETLVDMGALELEDDEGLSIVSKAARIGFYSGVEKLTKLGAKIFEENCLNPIHLAVFSGNTRIIKFLVQQRIPIDLPDNYGRTALHFAYLTGSETALQFLLENGADIEAIDDQRRSVLHLKRDRNSNCLEILLASKQLDISLVNYKDKINYTPLNAAADRGDTEAMEALVNAGATFETNTVLSPIYVAIRGGHEEAVRKAVSLTGVSLYEATKELDRGILESNVYFGNPYGDGHHHLVKALVELGADINQTDADGCSPLCFARTPEMVVALVNVGMDVNAKNPEGFNPLSFALTRQGLSVARQLVQCGANVNQRGSRERTAIFFYKGLQALEYLISEGADLNALDIENNSVLHVASRSSGPDEVRLLLEKGMDVNLRNSSGKTPLMFADGWNIVTLLLSFGADVNVRDNYGRTVMHYIVGTRYVTAVQSIVQKGADVNAIDDFGNSVLVYACHKTSRDDDAMVKELIKYGCNINAVDGNGNTALHKMIMENKLGGVVVLMEAGADVYVENKEGKTPLDIAKMMWR